MTRIVICTSQRTGPNCWDQNSNNGIFYKEDVTITSYRKTHQQLEPFFKKESNLVFCSDFKGLMNALRIINDSQGCRIL